MPRFRFSIGMICAMTAITALVISHTRTSWELSRANSKIEWLENARVHSWPNPEMISAVSTIDPSDSFQPQVQHAHWRWKIMLPNSLSFCLHYESSSKMLSVAPESLGTHRTSCVKLPTGEFELEIEISKGVDGQHQLKILAAGDATTIPMPDDFDIFDKSGFITNIAGIKQTATGSPDIPFLLACVREYARPGKSSEGIKLWLEPSPQE